MADAMKTAILDVRLDTGDSAAKAAELRDEILRLKEAQKENKRETEDQKAAYEATDAIIKSNTERLAVLTQAMKNQETATKSNVGSFNQLQASMKVGESVLKQLEGTIKKNADGTFQLTEEYFKQKKQVDEARNALLLFNAGIAQGNLNVGNYDNTLNGMRARLADLEIVIQNTNVDDLKLKELIEDAENTKTKIQQLSGEIDSMGNKTAKNKIKDNFNDMQGAAQALTGGISLLSLTMDRESGTAQALQKVMVGLTVAQTALTLAKSKDDVIGTAVLIKDKAITAAKWLQTAATTAATRAQLAFNATMIGAALATFALMIKGLADEWKNYKESLGGATSAQLAMNKARDEFAEKEKTDFEKRLERFEKVNSYRLQEIDLLEAQGEKDEVISQMRKDNLEKTIALYKQMLDEVKVSGDAYNLLTDKIQNASFELRMLNAEMANNSKTLKEQKEKLQDTADFLNDYYLKLMDMEEKANAGKREEAWAYYEWLNGLIKSSIEEQKVQYDDMGEAIVDTYDNISEVIIQSYKEGLARQAEALSEHNVEVANQMASFAEQVGQIFGDSLTSTGLDLQKFAQGVITLLLDTLEKTIIAAQAEALAKQVAEKGFVGIGTAAIQIALIAAAFESAKAIINQPAQAEFYEGGYTGEGNPKEVSTAVGKRPYTYHKDEYVVPSSVLNDRQGAELVSKLEKMRIGMPKIGGFGYADGGFASNYSVMLRQQQSGLTASDLAQLKLVVRVTDINDAQKAVLVSDQTGAL